MVAGKYTGYCTYHTLVQIPAHTVQIYKGTKWRFTTTIYFKSLETVHVFRLFTREGDMEYTGCGNTEHRDLKTRVLYRPDCRLAQISLRKGGGEHDLHCDGS